MSKHVFVGFGFGPIQSGLFLSEAFKSGNFDRLVVAEIDASLVQALRKSGGKYFVNVAHQHGIEVETIEGVEILNPTIEEDRSQLLQALREATEVTTSLPAVRFYDMGENSVASLIAKGLAESESDATVVYAAENNNHAAEILQQAVEQKGLSYDKDRVQFLNTVIGKMSQVVNDAEQIVKQKIQPMVPGIERAFLVEAFNRILVTKCTIDGFVPGIEVFAQKDDLLPFEEAKLYGHNAIHALLAYLGSLKNYQSMSELGSDAKLMGIARSAFLDESGVGLIKKHGELGDELFTKEGYREYAEDLLERMTNPWLTDAVDRAARDPVRKLGFQDRIYGTMRIALSQGVQPENMALGAAAGLIVLLRDAEQYEVPQELCVDDPKNLSASQIESVLKWLWSDGSSGSEAKELIALTADAFTKLQDVCGSA